MLTVIHSPPVSTGLKCLQLCRWCCLQVLGVGPAHVSIAHDGDYAVAHVILECADEAVGVIQD
jgi:hypothetical protein